MKLMYAADFETTVYDGQINTEVWSSAIAPLYDKEDTVYIHHSIEETFKFIKRQKRNLRLYYHNLRFDGEFWLSFLMKRKELTPAVTKDGNPTRLREKEFTYLWSMQGQAYYIKLRIGGKTVEIFDSLKLMPYSLKRIGESFKTKHKKLEMEYKGFRYAGCPISAEEEHYIRNDVLVLKEALEIMFDAGHKKMTIGSCCLSEFKKGMTYEPSYYPDLSSIELPENYKYKTAEQYIRKSYYGGWCYLKEGCERKVFHDGFTVDANSLYPSVMHSNSGNRYPVGLPTFFKDKIPEFCQDRRWYYFVRINCSFELRPGFLPFIQIKSNLHYPGTKCLKTSDIYDASTNLYYHYIDDKEVKVELVMTCVDFRRFLEFYDVEYEVIDGCYFRTEIGIFDEYIDHYYEQKEQSTGAKREEAKLFLNNLYGKMASSTDSSYKMAYLDENGIVKYELVRENNKEAGYIAIGSAITSYARDTTIRAAQANYENFIYSDTDSLHCLGNPLEVKGIQLHKTAICKWKVETEWETGWFVRAKTYIEIEKESHKMEIKCAGMPERAKENFRKAMNGDLSGVLLPKNDKRTKFTIEDFDVGLRCKGKLLPKRYPGGFVLTDTIYTMHLA